jgi:molecular chaperone GrpE
MMKSEQRDEATEQDLSADGPRGEPGREEESGGDLGGSDSPDAEQQEGSGTAEVEALRDRYLRLAAEFDNYRKRTERERTESWGRAQAQLVERLLDGLDDLQRVADFAPSTSVDSLLEGVQMVERKLLRALETAGLEVMEPAGERFDPAAHEALMTGEAEDAEEDETVGMVLQKGYRFNNILLRPARVQVRKFNG